MLFITYLINNIDRETWNRFKAKCATNGKRIKDVLPDLVKRVADGEIEITDRPDSKGKDKKR